jgi:hypothetical protein
MPVFTEFCGGSNTEASPLIDAQLSVNLFRSTVEHQGSAKAAYLRGTPGLRRILAAPSTSLLTNGRGLFYQDGRGWTVIGDRVYELVFDQPSGVVTRLTDIGSLPNDGNPVNFSSNGDGGNQVVVCGGGQLKVINLATGVLSAPIVLPLTTPPQFVGYMDGYFVLSEKGTIRFWFSAIDNGTSWDALDFVSRSTASDRIVAVSCANSRVWVFGTETTEAYEDVGDADNPFQPIKGSLFQIGLAAPYSLSLGVATMRWVGRSATSGAAVYRLDGYQGVRVSTHALEASLAQARTLADAEALTYEQDGHLFYALTVPSMGPAGDTVVLDETEHEWHHRRAWNATAGREECWRVRGHIYTGVQHVVGSRDSPLLWVLDLNTYQDDGQIQRARRRAPYMGAENTYASIDAFELGCEPGLGLNSGQGVDPQVELFVSRDGAKTWNTAGAAPLGKMGHYGDRTVWTQLGQARIDRLVFEVVITDPVKRVIGPGAWLRVTPGRPG